MTNEEQIKQHLSEIMGLYDDQQRWNIKGLAKLRLVGRYKPTPTLQESCLI